MIKPCPFCSVRAHKRTIEIPEYESGTNLKRTGKILRRRLIECRNPKCLIEPSTWLHVDTLEWDVAIQAWNKRT